MEESIYVEKELFKTTLRSIGEAVISTNDKGQILLFNEVSEKLTGWQQKEALGKNLKQVFQIINESTQEPCENLAEVVLETGEAIEIANHTLLINQNGEMIPIEERAAPIRNSKGKVIGVVIVFRDVTEKREKQKQIEYLSFHDSLTGLYNRRFMEETIKKVDVSQNLPITIMGLDVNALKFTNDAFGHEIGDKLLIKIAEILNKICSSEDIIARIGGDKFLIIFPQTTQGKAMKFCQKEVETIKLAGLLHDIGKIMVPPELLNKKERLTDEEFEIIKAHSETGYFMLRNTDQYVHLAEFVRYHHERFDGHGYPKGLKGNQIPLECRIIAVADSYEAMTAIRPYQKTKTNREALLELKRCSGLQFDPQVVEPFLKIMSG